MAVRSQEKTMSSKENPEDMAIDNAWAMAIEPFTKEDNPRGLIAESSFATLFPKYREKYIQECLPLLKNTLTEHGIRCELDLVEGSISVYTTKDTWDPYIIIKARDVIRLLARSVPFEQCIKVLKDEIACDIIKISGMVPNKERFVKRRERIVGPKGSTLKAIELLTNCYVLVQGRTVSAVGPYKGLIEVRRIVEAAMKNEHPVYQIKTLMIKRELARDPELKNEDWSRFLPKFETKNVQRKKSKLKKKKAYTPFPPPQPDSKIDKELATGEYFLKEDQRRVRKMTLKEESKKKADQVRQAKRNKSFIPPQEGSSPKKMKSDKKVDVEGFKKKMKANQKKKIQKSPVNGNDKKTSAKKKMTPAK